MRSYEIEMSLARWGTPAVKLAQVAYDYLFGKLISGEVLPGEILNRREIAGELMISVAPVLEALVLLQSEGIVESIPRLGTRIRRIEIGDYEGQRIVRCALECRAARLYYGQPVRRDFCELVKLAEAVDDSLGNLEGWWHSEMSFHVVLAQLSGVPALGRAVWEAIRREAVMGVLLGLPGHDSDEDDCHSCLLNELSVADCDAAEQLMRRHLFFTINDCFTNMSPKPREQFSILDSSLSRREIGFAVPCTKAK